MSTQATACTQLIYPVKLESVFIDPQIVSIFKQWLFQSDRGWYKDEEPCIPVGIVGPSIVLGHYTREKLEQSHWDKRLFQHVRIPQEQYHSILEGLAISFDKTHEARGNPPYAFETIASKEDFINLLLNHYVLEESLRPFIESFRNRNNWDLHDLPEGYEDYFNFLRYKTPLVPLAALEITDTCFESILKSLQERYGAIAFSIEGSMLYAAVSKHSHGELEDLIISKSNGLISEVILCGASKGAIEDKRRDCLQRRKKEAVLPGAAQHNLQDEATKSVLEINTQQMEKLDIQKGPHAPEALFQWLLYEAIHRDATDIHIEQCHERGRVRLRIDGELFVFYETLYTVIRALVTVCKNVCSMSSNTFDNQDAAFSVKYEGQKINLRVNAIPFRKGIQKLALRILPRKNSLTTLDKLGLAKDHLSTLRRAITRKQGLILITGPTGEGKTTTLYAALSEINKPNINIQTIEDPIEREIEGINQTAVNLAQDITFAKVMRSIVRQDPNVILLGEIRDRESAELAIEAALTGHLVFSTLHANSALKAIQRLIQLGVPHYLLADSLIMIQAQRLIKRLCHRCKEAYPPSEKEIALFNAQKLTSPRELYKASGCSHCDNTGYSGRVAVMELVPVNAQMEKLILEQATFLEVQAYCQSAGVRNLYQDALLKCAEGLTSLEQARVFEEVWT